MKTVLVVDDEKIVLALLDAILIRAGLHVLKAESSAQALALQEVQTGVIDLLITNHNLNRENGREVADLLRPMHPNMKVLQISGHAIEELEADGTKFPGGSFLQKPFTASKLTDVVKELLEIE